MLKKMYVSCKRQDIPVPEAAQGYLFLGNGVCNYLYKTEESLYQSTRILYLALFMLDTHNFSLHFFFVLWRKYVIEMGWDTVITATVSLLSPTEIALRIASSSQRICNGRNCSLSDILKPVYPISSQCSVIMYF